MTSTVQSSPRDPNTIINPSIPIDANTSVNPSVPIDANTIVNPSALVPSNTVIDPSAPMATTIVTTPSAIMSTTTVITPLEPQLPSTAHLDRVGYLFGYPIAHSMSPLMHQTIYDALSLKWSMFLLASLDLPHFLTLMRDDPKFYGAAVTMPHKLAIIPHLDELTEEGRDVGAVNTIFVRERNGKRVFCGTNTDVIGIRESFYQNIKDPDETFHNRPGMVVGGGGAARSAVYAMHRWMRCSPIYIVNRDPAEVAAVISSCTAAGYGSSLIHVQTVAQAMSLPGPGAVVACVPDIPPRTPAELEARGVVEVMLGKAHKGAVLEMAYHPRPWTEMAGLAKGRGWRVIVGTEAMIYQGLEQDRLWTGRGLGELPAQRVKEVISARLRTAGL